MGTRSVDIAMTLLDRRYFLVRSLWVGRRESAAALNATTAVERGQFPSRSLRDCGLFRAVKANCYLGGAAASCKGDFAFCRHRRPEIPKAKSQTKLKRQMPNQVGRLDSDIGIWNLFGIWLLGF